MKKFFWALLALIPYLFFGSSTTLAVVDPLASPNNKYGIHIIQATESEIDPAQKLVNSSGGDWGYITVLIESKDRNPDKWQSVFNDLRRRHLIPIVRLATQAEGSYWKRPYDGEEIAWADFLDNLVWPIKNRYVTIYNEPNHATEWGNSVDARDYAKVLDKTITALKNKNEDFFVLNAGFDASAPEQLPKYQEQYSYMVTMNSEVPGIFNKLDGWVSHSYPNPGFISSPNAQGRGTVRTYLWELEVLKGLGVTKKLPIFITETGWKHAEGINYDRSLPTAETVANYYKNAFENAWNHPQIVAVTPFLLSYQEAPFDHFSFKKPSGETQNQRVLGAEYPEYYPQYQTLVNLNKTSGKPIQEYKAELIKGTVYKSIVAKEEYAIDLTFKNKGQAIWGEYEPVSLVPILGGNELGIESIKLEEGKKVEPGQEYTFKLKLKAPQSGTYNLVLNLANGSRQFVSDPLQFRTEVKSPVILKIKSSLKWKNNPAGEYILDVVGVVTQTFNKIILGSNGETGEIEVKPLVPDYAYDFTLSKPFYQSKTIRQSLNSGINILDFGELQPNIGSALLNPLELWRILPFSN